MRYLRQPGMHGAKQETSVPAWYAVLPVWYTACKPEEAYALVVAFVLTVQGRPQSVKSRAQFPYPPLWRVLQIPFISRSGNQRGAFGIASFNVP